VAVLVATQSAVGWPDARHPGAAQTLRETIENKIYGYYLPDESLRARAAQEARKAMGEDAYDDAQDTGRALPRPCFSLGLRQRATIRSDAATAM
jgi:hypothetical protein